MVEVRTAHTANLDRATLEAARAVLHDVFEGDVPATIGSTRWAEYALVWDGDELIGHGSVIQRRLLHGGRALRAGYIEGVGTRANRRRRGHGTALMRALERVLPPRSPPRASLAPPTRTAPSTSLRSGSSSTSPAGSPVTGATATGVTPWQVVRQASPAEGTS